MLDLLRSAPSPLIALIGFLLTILFLVFIHEYGHFWMARRFGVKIEKFSIGFGKPIVKWHGKRDNTEYSISWIPLGGYVKMYGEDSQEAVSTDNHHEHLNNSTHDISDFAAASPNQQTGSFSALPPVKRFLIAFAGPAVNLMFAVFAMWMLFIIGVPAFKPYVGSISKSSPLYEHVQSGDEVLNINGTQTDTLTETIMLFVDNIGNANTPMTVADADGVQKTTTLDLSGLPSGSELGIEKALGFQWEMVEISTQQPATLAMVAENSPAATAGLAVGDTIININQTAINHWQDFVNMVQQHPEKALTVTVLRQGAEKTLSMTPATHPKNEKLGYAGVSPKIDERLRDKYLTTKRYGGLAALPMAVKENYLQAKLLLKTLGRIITGKASIKNMGGPLTIADYSGKSLQMGYVTYVKFLAAISLTLAIMNLLPIPVLDGGHMAMCLVEMVRGKPLSDRTVGFLMRIGMSVMLTFMLIVITVDLWKYLQ